jgi:hypothetical protein
MNSIPPLRSLTNILLLAAMPNAHAAYVHFCADAGGQGLAANVASSGVQQRMQPIAVDNQPSRPGCETIALPVAAELIEQVRPVPSSLLREEALLIQGSEKEGRSAYAAISPGTEQAVSARPVRPAMPMRTPLLPQMEMRVFGAEERVQASLKNGSLELQCRPGARPAGVILSGPWNVPLAAAELTLSQSGQGQFELLAADASLAARESGVRLGMILPVAEAGVLRLPLSPGRGGLDRAQWRHFSIACGAQGGVLHMSGLQLEPVAREAPARSRWQWKAEEWQRSPETVLTRAARQAVRVLHLSVPFRENRIAEPEALAAFIRLANARSMQVWSVDGDPRMVLPSEQAKAVQRVRAYAAYNAAHPSARLAGMQFDVEPYLLAEEELQASATDRHYLDLVRSLGKAAGALPLEMVVPFWWSDRQALLTALAPHVSGLNVMDYRTRHDEIYRFAASFLDWGARHGKQVRIALEAGPVAPEYYRRYVRAESGSGEVWLMKAGGRHLLVALRQALPNPAGPSYRLAAAWTADGSATSFAGAPERLMTMLPGLEQEFAAWPSFSGIALHELD